MKLSKTISKQRSQINDLEKIKLDACKTCKEQEVKISVLSSAIKKFGKGQSDLEEILSKQRHATSRTGLGFSNSSQSCTSKTIFVKASNPKTKDVHKMDHAITSNSYNHRFACTYCNTFGHTQNTCYIRKYGVPHGEYKWVRKGTNMQGPKSHWVPNKSFDYFVGNGEKYHKYVVSR